MALQKMYAMMEKGPILGHSDVDHNPCFMPLTPRKRFSDEWEYFTNNADYKIKICAQSFVSIYGH